MMEDFISPVPRSESFGGQVDETEEFLECEHEKQDITQGWNLGDLSKDVLSRIFPKQRSKVRVAQKESYLFQKASNFVRHLRVHLTLPRNNEKCKEVEALSSTTMQAADMQEPTSPSNKECVREEPSIPNPSYDSMNHRGSPDENISSSSKDSIDVNAERVDDESEVLLTIPKIEYPGEHQREHLDPDSTRNEIGRLHKENRKLKHALHRLLAIYKECDLERKVAHASLHARKRETMSVSVQTSPIKAKPVPPTSKCPSSSPKPCPPDVHLEIITPANIPENRRSTRSRRRRFYLNNDSIDSNAPMDETIDAEKIILPDLRHTTNNAKEDIRPAERTQNNFQSPKFDLHTFPERPTLDLPILSTSIPPKNHSRNRSQIKSKGQLAKDLDEGIVRWISVATEKFGESYTQNQRNTKTVHKPPIKYD